MPLRVFIVTGTSYGVGRARPPRSRISPSRPRFHGSAPPPPLRVTLGTGQPKLRSMWATPYSAHEDLGGLADVDRVGAVELHRADRLELVEDQHLQRGLVALDQAAAR